MRAIPWIAALLIVSAVPPVTAARAQPQVNASVYPLHLFRGELYRGEKARSVTQAYYLKWRGRAVSALPTSYSDRKGAPIGLFVLQGYVHQGNTRKRCFLHLDKTGRVITIGYKLPTILYAAFEAGPCIVRWQYNGRSGIYIAGAEERFTRGFLAAPEERRALCIDTPPTRLAALEFFGPLWRIQPLMDQTKTDRCLNLDGGDQAGEHAEQPAVLGIVWDPLSTSGF